MGAGASGDAVGIGSSRRWPCAGDPESGVAYSCPREGSLSVLAAVPAAALGEDQDDDAPVLLHVTACREHVGAVRHWLRRLSPLPDQVDTWSTALLVDEFGQVRELMADTPVYSLMSAVG